MLEDKVLEAALSAGKDDIKAPEGNLYSDADRQRVKSQYGENWHRLSWFDQQRALAHDSWLAAADTGDIDEDTLLAGIFDDPEVQRINKREEEFATALRNALKVDVSRLSDDEAQGYYMDLVATDPRFGIEDEDGSKLFGVEAQYGKGNLSRLLGVYKGTNPNGLFSREAQRWLESNEAQKLQIAKERRKGIDMVLDAPSVLPSGVAGMPQEVALVDDREVVSRHEKRLMANEKAVQFATLMGSLSPAGQEVVKAALKADELDGRTLRFLDKGERENAMAAYRCFKDELDANWWLTQGGAQAWELTKSMATGSWRMLANLYMTTGGRLPEGSKEKARYEEEQLMQLQIEDAERYKYKDSLTALGKVGAGLLGTVPYMAAMSNPYTGTVATLAMSNDVRERMILEGVDPETALAVSLPVGIVEGWIEKIQWEGVFGGSLSEFAIRRASIAAVLKQLAKKKTTYLGGNLLRMGREAVVTTLTEDAEEVLQQLAEELGVSIAKGEFDTRQVAEALWDTAVESLPTTAGFGLMRVSGAGPALHRKFSRKSVASADFTEYIQSLNAAKNVLAQKEAPPPGGNTDGLMQKLLDDLRTRWTRTKTAKGRVNMLLDSGLNAEQAAVVDEFFRLESDFMADYPVFSYYDESGVVMHHFEISELPSLMKGVEKATLNEDGTYTLDLRLDKDTVVPVKVEAVKRSDLREANKEQFEKQVRIKYEEANGEGSWDKLSDDAKEAHLLQAVPGGFTTVTVADETIPFAAVVQLAAPDRMAGDGGAKPYEVGHEIFHAATLIADKMGILTAEDIEKMKKVFGNPKAAGYLFNEEDAADAYGRFIASKLPNDELSAVFAKIRDFFRRILNALTRREGNEEDTALTAENIFKAIERGDLRGISALSGVSVNEDAAAKTGETKDGEAKTAEAPAATGEAQAVAEVPGVATIEAEVVEVAPESLATKNDADFDPALAEVAPVIVNTEPADGVPVVVGGGNVLTGSDAVEKARREGKKKLKVKRIRKVKTAKKPKKQKGGKPGARKTLAEMNPFERNKFLSVKRFCEVHGESYPLMRFWLDNGHRIIARPDKGARAGDFLELLSQADRMFLTGFGKGGIAWDELPQEVGGSMADMEPEAILERALKERADYIAWKEAGGLSPEDAEAERDEARYRAEGVMEPDPWEIDSVAGTESRAEDSTADIDDLIENDIANGRFSVRDTLSLLNDMAEQELVFGGVTRFSAQINPNLHKDVMAALTKNSDGHYVTSGSKAIQIAGPSRVLEFLGVRLGSVFTIANVVQKMEYKHHMDAEQIGSLPNFYDDPAAVFLDIDGKGANVILTELKGVANDGSHDKPVMVLLRPSKRGDGGYIASAYPRDKDKETAYIDWIGKLRYINTNKIAGLNLEVGTVSRLKPQAAGDNVKTPQDYSAWSSTHSIANLAGGNQGRFSMSSPVERRKDLIALHNVDAKGLRGMDELGGLAAPSFAVTKDTMGSAEFGDISLIVRPFTIDPKRRGNKIFSNDAWTPTFPQIRLHASEKATDSIYETINSLLEKGGLRQAVSSTSVTDSEEIEKGIERFGSPEKAFASDQALKAAYLIHRGETITPVVKERKYYNPTFYGVPGIAGDNEALRHLRDAVGEELLATEINAASDETIDRIAKTVLGIAREEYAKKHPDKISALTKDGKMTREKALAFVVKDDMVDVGRLYHIREALERMASDEASRRSTSEYDTWATKDKISAMLSSDDPGYLAWVRKLYDGVIDQRGFRNERDMFTPQGNRRSFSQLHDPVTLANAVKAMLRQQSAQGNGIFGRNPFGTAAKEYTSLKEVIADEDRLRTLTKEEKSELKEALEARFGEVVKEYNETQVHPDDNPFTQYGNAAEMMLDAYATACSNKARLMQELNGWGYTASEDLVDRFIEVMGDMAKMPEDYFEAKAYRAVPFDEIAAAAIPDNASAESREILARRNVRTVEYKAGDNADRLRAVNEAADQVGDARFSITGIYTGSAADYDKPSLLKVGTGEGSQVYGWGLYGSTVRDVAKTYMDDAVHDPRGLAKNFLEIHKSRDAAIKAIRKGLRQNKAITEELKNTARKAIKLLQSGKPIPETIGNLYEQTFFTDRAPGDESHLLKWYEPVSEEQRGWIQDQLLKERIVTPEAWGAPREDGVFVNYTGPIVNIHNGGDSLYGSLTKLFGSPKAASEFLARAGIDGVKYPVDSYGKTVKDGDKAGWNYVSFRDDNIRVDHKWTDGEQRFSIVRDPERIAKLEAEPKIKVYRAMQVVDGKLYPPMAAKVDGEWQEPAELDAWLQSDERPDLADDKGYFRLNKGNGKTIKARYNPYFHTSRSPLNDQFSSAYDRPNLVTVEVEVPMSELTSGYKAVKAKDAVGEMSWHSGPVSSKLAELGNPRQVILTRWCKPIRVVPDTEVADKIATMLDGTDISIPANVVTPSLRAELEKRSVRIEYTPEIISQNVDDVLKNFDAAKGKTTEEIFSQFNHDMKVVAQLPKTNNLPAELRVIDPVVKTSENYILDHLHNHAHQRVYTGADAKRVLALVSPQHEARVVRQRTSSSIAFIERNPIAGWDCIVIAPRRGQYFVFKTMFGQDRKPYQDKPQVRFSLAGSSVRDNAVVSLLRGPLASIRDVDQSEVIIPNSPAPAQGGLPNLIPSEEPGKSRGAVSFSRDPADVISGMVAAKTRRGEIVKVEDVQNILATFGADTSLAGDIIERGRRTAGRVGDIIKDKVVDDSTFFDLALSESKRSRVLALMERSGEEGYRLGAEDERSVAALAKAKSDAVLFALANATGFNAVSMELKYGFNMVQSVMNAKYHPMSKNRPGTDSTTPGEVDGPGMTLAEMEAAKAANGSIPQEVTARESAALAALKKKAAKRADEIDKEYGLKGGESPEQKQAEEDAAAGRVDESAEDAKGKGAGKRTGRRVRRDQLDFNRASDFLAFLEELVAKEMGIEAFDTPVQVRTLASTAKHFLTKIARQLCYSHTREVVMADIDKLADQVSLKFGDDSSEEYATLSVAGAFAESSSERIFEDQTKSYVIASL